MRHGQRINVGFAYRPEWRLWDGPNHRLLEPHIWYRDYPLDLADPIPEPLPEPPPPPDVPVNQIVDDYEGIENEEDDPPLFEADDDLLPAPMQAGEIIPGVAEAVFNDNIINIPIPGLRMKPQFERKKDYVEVIPVFGPSSNSGTPLTPFSMKYETTEEIQLRLRNTIIVVNDTPYQVVSILPDGRTVWLISAGTDGVHIKIDYYNPNLDLRSPQPKYVSYETDDGFTSVGYFHRIPARIYRQGLTSQNCCVTSLGPKKYHKNPRSMQTIMHMLLHQKDKQWNKALECAMVDRAIKSERLSNDVAVYERSGIVHVEYKTRPVGSVKKGLVSFDQKDADTPWIKEALRYAGFTF